MPILSSSGGGQRLCFAEGKSNPQPQGEKHEEDDCQDYLGYIFAACLGSSPHFGERR
jgi:hypothetical protein